MSKNTDKLLPDKLELSNFLKFIEKNNKKYFTSFFN